VQQNDETLGGFSIARVETPLLRDRGIGRGRFCLNWDAIAAAAELAGAAGVIASLAYLATQIRHSTRASRLMAHDSAVSTIRDLSKLIIESPDMARIVRIGMMEAGGDESLSPDDDLRSRQFLYSYLKASENLYYHWSHGSIDEATFRAWENMIATWLTAPAARAYRLERHAFFPDSFHTWIESLESEGSRLRGESA
jgi:hypothetical protein